jgi:hypothetical protein
MRGLSGRERKEHSERGAMGLGSPEGWGRGLLGSRSLGQCEDRLRQALADDPHADSFPRVALGNTMGSVATHTTVDLLAIGAWVLFAFLPHHEIPVAAVLLSWLCGSRGARGLDWLSQMTLKCRHHPNRLPARSAAFLNVLVNKEEVDLIPSSYDCSWRVVG